MRVQQRQLALRALSPQMLLTKLDTMALLNAAQIDSRQAPQQCSGADTLDSLLESAVAP